MAESVASKSNLSELSEVHEESPVRRGGEITGLFLLAVAVGLFLAIYSFVPSDINSTGEIQNLIGPLGAYTADILLYVFGLGSFFFVGVIFLLGAFMLIGRRPDLKPSEFVGYGLFVFAGATVSYLVFGTQTLFGHNAGGLVGDLLGKLFTNLIGHVGTYLLAGCLGLLALMLVTDMSIGTLVRWLIRRVQDWGHSVAIRYKAEREFRRQLRRQRAEERAQERPEEEPIEEMIDPDLSEEEQIQERARIKMERYRARMHQKELQSHENELLKEQRAEEKRAARETKAQRRASKKRRASSKDSELHHDTNQDGDVEQEDFVTEDDAPVPSVMKTLQERRARRAKPEQPKAASPKTPPAITSKAPSSPPAGPQIVESEAQRKAREFQKNLDRTQGKLAKPTENNFELPPLSFLNFVPSDEDNIDHEKLREMAVQIEKTLSDFNVEGEVVEICPGPVITMFEFSPAPGVKLSKIAGLSDDLAMALAAMSVRIIAPIPGKGVVGIEVPNDTRETVYLKEVLAHDNFQSSKGKMPMGLGKATAGEVVVADMASMPHLLVAGATGSGKSVAVNTMIVSLLYRFTPEDVRLIMVDPKMLEFSIYEGIPHLLLPVVTDPAKAANALRWAVEEMERRYRLLADLNVRNLVSYNRKVASLTKQAEADLAAGNTASDAVLKLEINAQGETRFTKLPYIVCIIDEFADLMMVASKDVETAVARLAQKARACGIHLILATQRPSVDVITGLIKANFPTRIALRVAQRTDSRTILDSNGAENLLGRGDMLYLPPGTSSQQRVHGAFVSEDEIEKVVDFLKAQGSPEYDESILSFGQEASEDGGGSSGGGEEEYDEHYDAAIEIVSIARQASISMLQRKLRVGYNRAARLVERMEEDGIVGPSDGARPREVLIPPPPEV